VYKYIFLVFLGLFNLLSRSPLGGCPSSVFDEEIHEQDEQADRIEEQNPRKVDREAAHVGAAVFDDDGERLVDQRHKLDQLEESDERFEHRGPSEERAQ